MKLIKKTYRIIGFGTGIIFLIPIIVLNTHIILHHANDEPHYHDVISFCSEEVEVCEYSNFTFNFFTHSFNLTNFFIANFVSNLLIEPNYFIYKKEKPSPIKGRAPPYKNTYKKTNHL